MADAAFITAKYPAYTTAQLQALITAGNGNLDMEKEIARRVLVEAGVLSVMTPGERLRHISAA